MIDAMKERDAVTAAEMRARAALSLMEESERRLDGVGLFGLGGVAHEATLKLRKLLKRLASVSKVEG